MIRHYDINDVRPYINWVYFFHAWGFAPQYASIADIHGCDACKAMWLISFPESERGKAAEAMQLFKEANRMIDTLNQTGKTHALFRLMKANSADNDIWLEETRLPLLRQQTTKENSEEPYLCLSDFVRPKDSGTSDQVGIFATTVDLPTLLVEEDDKYQQLLKQTLADRLAEATAEKTHEEVRKEIWGYAPDEDLTIKQLHQEKYQGMRPAVGYPSLPDLSINFLLDELLDMKQIGITLTENGMMRPHASVSGLMLAHPACRHFSVGKIDEAQLKNYALRRGMPLETMKKFLIANI
jgi:cobalamin-dependent methionine synthase I